MIRLKEADSSASLVGPGTETQTFTPGDPEDTLWTCQNLMPTC